MTISLNALQGTGPSWDEPVDMLAACHERIFAQCDTLLRLVDHVAIHGADPAAREAAVGILRYFDTAGEHHHRDEEEDLFPALRKVPGSHALEIEALLAALLMEHGRMRQAWQNQLRPALEQVSLGQGAISATMAQTFVGLYRAHIDREERELLPLARKILGEEELREMGQRMAGRRGARPFGTDKG
jgi:hemerythrin-like domain-containing protein